MEAQAWRLGCARMRRCKDAWRRGGTAARRCAVVRPCRVQGAGADLQREHRGDHHHHKERRHAHGPAPRALAEAEVPRGHRRNARDTHLYQHHAVRAARFADGELVEQRHPNRASRPAHSRQHGLAGTDQGKRTSHAGGIEQVALLRASLLHGKRVVPRRCHRARCCRALCCRRRTAELLGTGGAKRPRYCLHVIVCTRRSKPWGEPSSQFLVATLGHV